MPANDAAIGSADVETIGATQCRSLFATDSAAIFSPLPAAFFSALDAAVYHSNPPPFNPTLIASLALTELPSVSFPVDTALNATVGTSIEAANCTTELSTYLASVTAADCSANRHSQRLPDPSAFDTAVE